MKRAPIFVLPMAGLLLAGCVDLPGLGPPPSLYDLSPKTTFRETLPRVAWQLVVEEPLAAGGLDTVRIASKPWPLEVQYFASSRWTERAPKMVQTLLIESFENTGKIIAVGRQSVGLRSDFNLKGELREFQAEYAGSDDKEPPVIRVRLNVKLVQEPRQEIIASQNFEQTVKARDGTMQAVVLAFDESLNRVLRDIVEWTFTTLPTSRPGGKAAGS